MITNTVIESFLKEKLQDSPIFIVEVVIKPGNRIYVFLDSMDIVTIEDCVRINKMITGEFDREVEDYALEVSSAGLTSAFKTEMQYKKHTGKNVKIKTNDGLVVRGILSKFENNILYIDEITVKKKIETRIEHVFKLEDISETKLNLKFF